MPYEAQEGKTVVPSWWSNKFSGASHEANIETLIAKYRQYDPESLRQFYAEVRGLFREEGVSVPSSVPHMVMIRAERLLLADLKEKQKQGEG